MLPAIAAAGASLIGGLGADLFNVGEASANRAFQERMADTVYQRGVADMRKAGLNPILAAGGSGAPAPSGSILPVSDPLGPAVSSAMQASLQKKQADLLESQKNKTDVDATTTMYQGQQAMQAGNESIKRQSLLDLQREVLELGLPALKHQASIMGGKGGDALSWLTAISNAVFGGSGMMRPFSPKIGGE